MNEDEGKQARDSGRPVLVHVVHCMLAISCSIPLFSSPSRTLCCTQPDQTWGWP